MFRLPLFPLGVVLFPGASLPLHIFEPRYRRMVARCLEHDRRFGLVFHDSDRFGPFLTETGRVGCVAEIEEFQVLPDGRSLILTTGRERFRIQDSVESEEPYYDAVVEEMEDDPVPGFQEASLVERRRQSIALFHSVLDSLPSPPESFPEFDEEEELSFRLAPTIQIDPVWQQRLLQSVEEAERLDQLDMVFRAALERGREA